jgi:serine/threonine protein kinase
LYEQVAGLLGKSTTYSSELESVGALLLGSAWGGVHAADTLPAPASTLTCRVVNGITLYELASGRPLPDGGDRSSDLRDGKLEDLPHLSNAFKGLIRAMMHPDPQERPSAAWLASMAEKELLAKAAEAEESEGGAAFGRVPRKSGPFSPLESPMAQPNGMPSPVLGGASPAGGTLREQQLEQQATDMREEMNRYKQQLADAKAEIGRLTGCSPAASSGVGSQSSQGDASPELCSQKPNGGDVAMFDDDDATENQDGSGGDGERKQLSFEDAAAESPGNTSFGSIDAEVSQEL